MTSLTEPELTTPDRGLKKDALGTADIAFMLVSAAAPLTIVVGIAPHEDPAPWAAAGATWVLAGFGMQPRADAVRDAIGAGPG